MIDETSALAKASELEGEVALPEGAPTGFEGVKQEDLGIPVIKVLQKGSPQVDPSHPKHVPIEGASVGAIVLDPGGVVLAKGLGKSSVYVVPVGFRKVWTEFVARSRGGGLVSEHAVMPSDAMVKVSEDGRKSLVRSSGNEVVETAVWGVLVNYNGEWKAALLRLSGTGLGVSRQWLNRGLALRKPLYSQCYSLTTRAESSARGSYFVLQVDHSGPITKQALLERALQAHIDFKAAAVSPEPGADSYHGSEIM